MGVKDIGERHHQRHDQQHDQQQVWCAGRGGGGADGEVWSWVGGGPAEVARTGLEAVQEGGGWDGAVGSAVGGGAAMGGVDWEAESVSVWLSRASSMASIVLTCTFCFAVSDSPGTVARKPKSVAAARSSTIHAFGLAV